MLIITWATMDKFSALAQSPVKTVAMPFTNLNFAAAHIKTITLTRRTAPTKVAFRTMPPLQPEYFLVKKVFFSLLVSSSASRGLFEGSGEWLLGSNRAGVDLRLNIMLILRSRRYIWCH